MKKYLISIALLISFHIPLDARAPTGVPGHQYSVSDAKIRSLLKVLSHISRFSIKKEIKKEKSGNPTGVMEENYWFRSKKAMSKGPEGSTFLRFKLAIERYESVTAATAAFKVQQSKCLSRDRKDLPCYYGGGLVALDGNQVVTLAGDCQFSRENWLRLVEKASTVLLTRKPDKNTAFLCLCGGPCFPYTGGLTSKEKT